MLTKIIYIFFICNQAINCYSFSQKIKFRFFLLYKFCKCNFPELLTDGDDKNYEDIEDSKSVVSSTSKQTIRPAKLIKLSPQSKNASKYNQTYRFGSTKSIRNAMMAASTSNTSPRRINISKNVSNLNKRNSDKTTTVKSMKQLPDKITYLAKETKLNRGVDAKSSKSDSSSAITAQATTSVASLSQESC